jgi:hypothetical protein
MNETNNIPVPNATNDADHGNIQSGTIYSSSENRFNKSHYSEALTAFTVGWQDPENISATLDHIAPPVEVPRRFSFRVADPSSGFLSEVDDIRAPGASFKRTEYTGELVNEKTLNKGLTIRIDHDEIVGDHWQERYVQILIQRLLRSELRRAMTALSAVAGKGLNKVWGGDKASSPEADLLDAIISAGNQSGVEPNRALFGRSAWQMRHQLYANQDKAGAFAGLLLRPDELASTLGLQSIKIAQERFQLKPEQKTMMLGDSVILFHGHNVLGKDDPSNLKRFYTPTEGGNPFRVYIEDHPKYTDITVEHYSHIVTTSSLSIIKLNVTNK